MGGGTFDRSAYASFSSATVGKSTADIYDARHLKPSLNPKGVKVRESRVSADNPMPTPVIVALDVTGSMGMIADVIAREGLGVLFTGILDRKPVTDPHVMFMGVGDVAAGDTAPLQVSQFEADNRIVEQLTDLYLEHGGGGNDSESYHLPWYFAANHTVHDAMELRGKRGYLFTVGDECVPGDLTTSHIESVFGYRPQVGISAAEALAAAERLYDVYHIIVKEGNHCRGGGFDRVRESWTDLLGQRVVSLDDHTKLAETIVSVIEVAEGRDAEASAKGWGKGGRAVLDAVKHLPRGSAAAARPLLGHRP